MERITLNMVPTGVLEICHASQYDIGREIRFDLINGTDDFVLSGDEDIAIFIRDFDGNLIESSAPNTSSNYVVWTSSEGELDVSGPAICELRVTKDDDVLGSANFIMEIEADPYADTGVHVETVGPADICTFETDLAEPLQSVIVDVEATGGNGTPDSPNPIVGYSSANITRCGVNLWDEDWELGRFDTTTGANVASATQIRTKNKFRIKGGANYYITMNVDAGRLWCIFYDKDENVISTPTIPQATQTSGNSVYLLYEFTAPIEACFMRFYCITSYGTTYGNDISINYPSTDTTYHAYNGQTYTVAFGQTVYGGQLDVTRGKLHVTFKKVHLTSSLSYMYGGSAGNIWYSDNDAYHPTTTIESGLVISSHFKAVTQSVMGANDDCLCKTQNNAVIWIKDTTDGWTDVATFKTWLDTQDANNNPVEIAFKLATPFDIDITPKVISAIVGENNVFADCGQSTVKYLTAE